MALGVTQVLTAQGNGVATVNMAVSSTAAGSLLIIGGASWNRTFGAGNATDNQGNTYAFDQGGASANIEVGIFSKANATAAVTQVSVTGTGSVDDISIAFYEITGAATSSPKDVSTSNTGTSATHSSGTTGTTSQANEIVILLDGHEGSTATPTAGVGYTALTAAMFKSSASDIPIATTYKIVSATGTQTGSFSWDNAAYACLIATYKEAGGGGGGGSVKRLIGGNLINRSILRGRLAA